MEKEQNPISDEVLEFDFTKCSGSIDDTILALASVEKVFRMVKMPDATFSDTIRVDKKIDKFLSEYFNLYDKYCVKDEMGEDDSYTQYAYLYEDEQSDDLTMLALKRI